MSEKSKKGISLTGILTLVNIVLVIGIALLFYFGPAGAKANAKGALDFAIYCITLFQVNAGGFAISSVAIVLALASALAVLIILVLFVLYLARKAWKSLSAVFSLLLSTALVIYGSSFFLVAVRGNMNTIKPANVILVMVVGLLVALSFVLSLVSALSGTLGSFSNKIGGGVVREVVKENDEELEKKVAELEEKVKALEERKCPVLQAAAVVAETGEEPKEPINFTVKMVCDYVAGMTGEKHPVATENKEANGGNGPVSNNVDVCNMALTYGKENVSSLLIRLEAEAAETFKKDHSVEASNFAGSGDYYKLLVNDGSYTEEEQLWEIVEASYAYVLSKYFKVEDGKYVAVEEEPAEEVKEEPAPVVAPVVEEEDEKIIIERVPFADKVRRSDRELKDKYDELKAYLLSYGLKSRISIDGDTYRLHTVKYVHITIAGKKMKVYFALNPNDYLTSTTPVKEAKAKKYAEVKAYLDVKSDLSVKRAKALIDTVMQNAGIEKEAE